MADWCIRPCGDRIRFLFAAFALTIITLAAAQIHSCDRLCPENVIPLTCYYNFTVEQYLTLSKACYNCPLNFVDCYNDDCIPANGIKRPVVVVNRKMPGPLIAVCENDIVVVDVLNRAGSQATTIHWHGMNQVGTPFMDGVPFVTQCPVLSLNNFRYTFRAVDTGTYFYHSHVGFQRTDGFNGMLIVRQSTARDPNSLLYDFDLTEHVIVLADWTSEPGDTLFTEFYHSDIDINPQTILVNGRSRLKPFTDAKGNVIYTPLSLFQVRYGYRYRFRVCSVASFMCGFQLSIDSHRLLVIAVDGHPVEPVWVDSIVLTPAERFDFVLMADQPLQNYWIKIHGLLLCAPIFTAALLVYDGSESTVPNGDLNVFSTFRQGVVMNPVNIPVVGNVHVDIDHLFAAASIPDDPSLNLVPDVRFYLAFDLVPNYDPVFFDPLKYPWHRFPLEYQHPIPMINDIAFAYPPSPLMSQFRDVPDYVFCNETSTMDRNCAVNFCRCVHLLRVPLNSVVELVLVDVGNYSMRNFTHSFHLHGHHFRVLAQQGFTVGNSLSNIKKLDALGLLPRKLSRAPVKDTVSTPHGGYSIIRFHATNPGFWAFHCHVEFHTEGGMVLLFQVGEVEDIPPPPHNFPKCGNYKPPIPVQTDNEIRYYDL